MKIDLYYTSASGKRYRAVGRMPYAELVDGCHYALDSLPGQAFKRTGKGSLHTARHRQDSPVETLRQTLLGMTVILLEPLEDKQ